MGFDVECIVDAHTYPREYFCPVCETLVFPSEALQTLCTHLYCKPCLAYVANGTRACPYDGYSVTETESIPLIESDKTLAESIGKVKVRCLYHKIGCSWEGPLSDSTSHCSGCSFGNALATNCYQDNSSSASQTAASSGFPTAVQSYTQQYQHLYHQYAGYGPYQQHYQQYAAYVPFQQTNATASAGVSRSVQCYQQQHCLGIPASTSANPQTSTDSVLPLQDSNQQKNFSSQAAATVSAGVPSSDKSYQQFAASIPFNPPTHLQPNTQQYNPYQQQAVQSQNYQQHQVYMQSQAQTYRDPSQLQSQISSQPLNPPLPLKPQIHARTQQHLDQVQVNTQQQLPPTQLPSQFHTQDFRCLPCFSVTKRDDCPGCIIAKYISFPEEVMLLRVRFTLDELRRRLHLMEDSGSSYVATRLWIGDVCTVNSKMKKVEEMEKELENLRADVRKLKEEVKQLKESHTDFDNIPFYPDSIEGSEKSESVEENKDKDKAPASKRDQSAPSKIVQSAVGRRVEAAAMKSREEVEHLKERPHADFDDSNTDGGVPVAGKKAYVEKSESAKEKDKGKPPASKRDQSAPSKIEQSVVGRRRMDAAASKSTLVAAGRGKQAALVREVFDLEDSCQRRLRTQRGGVRTPDQFTTFVGEDFEADEKEVKDGDDAKDEDYVPSSWRRSARSKSSKK